MEDDLNGRQPQWTTTSMEDDLNGKNMSMEETSMEEDLKEALQEDDNSLFSKPILY